MGDFTHDSSYSRRLDDILPFIHGVVHSNLFIHKYPCIYHVKHVCVQFPQITQKLEEGNRLVKRIQYDWLHVIMLQVGLSRRAQGILHGEGCFELHLEGCLGIILTGKRILHKEKNISQNLLRCFLRIRC